MDRNPYLKIEKIVKVFPGVRALDQVDVEAFAGEALGLVGINGAGKSTLMNILAGIIPADAGNIFINSERVTISNPNDAERYGITLIHQEPIVFSQMTVAENIFISQLRRFKEHGKLNYDKMYDEAKNYLDMLGSTINPRVKAANITTGEKQMVEIARALAQGASIILFDEPTSSLTIKEKKILFSVIEELKRKEKTIIYITHFIDEVFQLCEKVTVMRDGKVAGAGETGKLTTNDIVRIMIGDNVISYVSPESKRSQLSEDVILSVKHINRGKHVVDVSFNIKKGEVVGIWGLLGSGRTELIRAMLGLDKLNSGEIYLKIDGALKRVSSKELLKRCGYVTENRHDDGLFLPLELWKNMTIASLNKFYRKIKFIMNDKKEIDASEEMIANLAVAAPNAKVRVEQLSGGNQQKVILARWLLKDQILFILDEPTRGVDVSAKAEIHKYILQLAEKGCSVLLVSSEIEEIINLSDRVLVMSKGSIVNEVSGKDITKEKLMALCMGQEEL